jgi:hypothetical protein
MLVVKIRGTVKVRCEAINNIQQLVMIGNYGNTNHTMSVFILSL